MIQSQNLTQCQPVNPWQLATTSLPLFTTIPEPYTTCFLVTIFKPLGLATAGVLIYYVGKLPALDIPFLPLQIFCFVSVFWCFVLFLSFCFVDWLFICSFRVIVTDPFNRDLANVRPPLATAKKLSISRQKSLRRWEISFPVLYSSHEYIAVTWNHGI